MAATQKPREVTIDLQTYNDLLLAHEKYEALLDVIYNSSALSFNKKHLVPDPVMLSHYLIAFDYQGYQNTFAYLTGSKGGSQDDKSRNQYETAVTE